MRCAVPACKNDSRITSKSDGITFHVLPTEVSARTAWLNILGRDNWEPKERSSICSEHFLSDDLYWTKNGMRKVRAGALPIVLQESKNCDFGESSSLNVCKICLATDVRLLSIRKYKLEEAYEKLTGFTMCEEDRLPHQLCFECSQRLLNNSRFRNKAMRANALLLEILHQYGHISPNLIQSIDRESNLLKSDLTTKIYEPNYSDYNLEYSEIENIEITPPIADIVKNEIFIEENVVESCTENDETIHHADDHTDEFSSEDSLPLKVKKKKKFKSKISKKIKTIEPKIDRRRKPFLNADLNETLFTITQLSTDEQIAEILKRQDTPNYKNAVYKCVECFKGFLDEDAYNSHMLRHTEESGEFRCEICKTHFKQSHALRKHLTAHHLQRFSCNQCPYVTTHRQTARLHERWHKGTKYQCPHCPDEFVKFTTYMGHIRIKHPSDFVCELCGYSFVSEKGIDLHKKLKHRVDKPVEVPPDAPYCEVCDVRFINEEALSKHIRVSARHFTDDKTRQESNKVKKRKKKRCLEDEQKNEEEDHERRMYPSQIRKAEGPIPCEQCGLQLEDSRAYHGHFRRMHPDKNRTKYPSMKSPCMCEVCGRIFQSFALLRDHTWLHTGERPFKCECCGKAFRMKQRLVAHRRVHSQEKATYVCSVCGKHFSTHSNRQRHMFIHTGLKPFKCEMCGKGFKHASEKRAHIEYVHLKKPWPKRSRGKRQERGRDEMPPWGCESKMDIPPDKPAYYNIKI